jgi:hypothetical protein
MKIILVLLILVGGFALLPVVYGPSVCPEDTNENNECVFYGTDAIMFPRESKDGTNAYEEKEVKMQELMEIENKNIQSLKETIQQKSQNDHRNSTIIKRDNIWFNEIIQKHDQLMQEINERLFGNVTNSGFGSNGNNIIDYFETHIPRSENKILQGNILNQTEHAKLKFCEKFGKFVNFSNKKTQNITKVTNLSINDIEMEFGKYSNSDICVEENDYKIIISSKDPKIMELTELIKTWIMKSNQD